MTGRRLDVTDPETFDIPDDLTVLVNNAGIDSPYRPVEHADLDDWRSLFETNVLGVIALTKAAIPALRNNHPSVVCNITSSSIIASVPFYSAYRATKAAVSAFGDTLRVELAPSGIRVVEILPGPIDTDMFRLSTERTRCGGLPRVPVDGLRSPSSNEGSTPIPRCPTRRWRPDSSSTPIGDSSGPMRYGCDPPPLSACWTCGASPTTRLSSR